MITKNISRHELACKCGTCGFDSMDYETIRVVQDCCDHFAEKLGFNRVVLRINSAARCYEYNRKIGSSDASQHPKGRAIDFTIDDIPPSDVYAFLAVKYPNSYGFGNYKTFTHADTRSGPAARW